MSGSPGQASGPANISGNNSYVTDQWIRKWELVVYNPSSSGPGAGQALILSAGSDSPGSESLRMKFQIKGSMIPTPNVAVIRVYNPNPETVMRMVNEFARVTLSAGYLNGRFGTIFDGWITQFRFGGETAVDKFVELYAQDGDLAFSHATVNRVLMPGFNSPQSIGEAISQAMVDKGVPSADLSNLGIVPTARPVVMYAMATDLLDVITRTTNTIWNIQNGKLVVIPAKGANLANETLVVNALTGLIGFPTLTNDGLEFRTLINPFASYGQYVRINNAEINQIVAGVGGGKTSGVTTVLTPQFGMNFYASTSDDNTYFIANVGFEGDTRGQDWYTDYIGIAVDVKSNTTTAAQGIFPTPSQVLSQDGVSTP